MSLKVTIENKTATSAKKPKTYFVIIMDESSSMSPMWDESISYFNDQITTIKEKAKEQDISCIYVKFSNDVREVFFDVSVEKIPQLTKNLYSPNGMTALLDSLGLTIGHMFKDLKDINDENVSVLLTCVTDGQENASKEFSRYNGGTLKIKQLIEPLKATNRWTFVFQGAAENFLEQATEIGINVGNTTTFDASSLGMMDLTRRSQKATENYFQARAAGSTITDNLYESVNKEDKEEDEDVK